MKNIFKINSISFAIKGHPFEIKGVEFETEANAQELATSGSNINNIVEIIGDIAERFDSNPTVVKEIEVKEESKPVKAEAVKVSESDFREIKPELPTSKWSGGEPEKSFNLTKEWRKIPVPEELKPDGTDKYRWEGEKGLLGDSVSINGSTYGAVYIHIYGMRSRCFISIRKDNVKFEDDIKPEEFEDFLEAINIPQEIKDYIKKVIEL